ncbi:hypothetical protein [Winogradskyella forsetii]|uniref:hypothetical protein n=1 Tax=Winogradskyella forsetii TaxID=2686077 RepID=UPI0015B9CFCD|nr:hypothetical protein [Winogradskyella forsetii]
MIHFLYNYALTRRPRKKRNWLNRWLLWQLYKYLKVHLVKYYKNVSMDSLGIDSNSDVIVSLTSFPARIDFVYLAIKSMLNQKRRPKKIILWLGEEYFPNGEENLPNSLLELKSLGLEIQFCEDIRAHTKYYYAFQKYPDELIVTVDDDIIYPVNLLQKLLEIHSKYPNCVVANRVRIMELDNEGYKPYREWRLNRLESNKNPSMKLIATGVGGVLYQSSLFQKSLYDLEGIKKINCIGDDIWLKAGQVVSDIPVVFTNYYFRQFFQIPDSQDENLFSKNVFDSDNDRQVNEVFAHFGITKKAFE